MGVHPTAIVDDSAQLDEGVEIGPYAVVGAGVRLGARTRIHAHAMVSGKTTLGDDCEVYPQAVLGALPQDRKLDDDNDAGTLTIGARNIFRESVTIHGGTPFGTGYTSIGDDCMFLVGSHVGHDAQIGSHVVFTNGAMVAGHSTVDDYAILGAMVGIHQFARVGAYAMIGAGAMVSHDAPPFSLVQGDRARLVGVNVVGLKRAQIATEELALLKRAFRTLFWRPGTLESRIKNTVAMAGDDARIRCVLDFIRASRRGVCMPRTPRPLLQDESAELES